MRRYLIAVWFCWLITWCPPAASAQKITNLATLDQVSGNGNLRGTQKISMAGVVFQTALFPYGGVGIASYDIAGKYTRLTATFGVRDGGSVDTENPPKYSIRVDGKVIKSGQVGLGDLEKVEIDLAGAKSLFIGLANDCWMAEPLLVSGMGSSSLSPTGDIPRPVLLFPADGARLEGSSTLLGWKAVSGAVNYSIEIVCTDASEELPATQQRVWVVNTKGNDTQATIDLSDKPKGEYTVQIVAFGKTRRIGRFSEPKVFVIVK